MKKITKYLLIGIMATSVMFACKKKDDDVVTPTATPEQNIIGSWMVTSLVLSPGLDLDGNGTITAAEKDIFNNPATFDPCEKDDLLTFMSDKSYKGEAGATPCPNDTLDTGTWTLINSALTINYSDGDKDVFTIVSLNSTDLSVTTTRSDLPGQTISGTLKKQ